MIRYVEQLFNGSLAYRSGCGITFMSEAESEYKEMIQKVYIPTEEASKKSTPIAAVS